MRTYTPSKNKDKAAKHAEIARYYAWQARQRRSANPSRFMARIRLNELERLFYHRYGPLLPDDDAGREDFEIAAHHISWLGGDTDKRIKAYADRWAPWMSAAETECLINRVTDAPRRWRADGLASLLGLKDAERTALKITSIGATDFSKADREERRKLKRREDARERRRRGLPGQGAAPENP